MLTIEFLLNILTKNLLPISWNRIIEAEGDYATLVTAKSHHLSNYGISALEAKLDPRQFIRVHRSDIINLHYIREIQKYPSSYDVILQNNDVVRVSRSYMDKIRELTF